MVQEEGRTLALSFFLYHNWVWQKLITMKWFRVVWLCPSFCCRNHSIRHMSWVWRQPSQVGKAYDWFQCWNCLGSSETVSDHPGVTVATLCLGFGTQQSMIFCSLNWVVTTVAWRSPFFEWGKFFILYYSTLEFSLVLWVLCCFQFW
jgi:hypothetical protein